MDGTGSRDENEVNKIVNCVTVRNNEHLLYYIKHSEVVGALKLNKLTFCLDLCLVLICNYFVLLFCTVWGYRFQQSRIIYLIFINFKDNSIVRNTYSYNIVGCAESSMLRSISLS